MKSHGLASIEIQTNRYIIPHNFHIVDSNFAIPCDGIIGIDFIKKFNCQLDFKQNEDWFIIRPNNLNFPIYVPITYSSGNNSLFLPARSQVIRKIDINSTEESIFIPNQEIDNGIYVANTIATSEFALIRLLNTTDTDQLINLNNLKYEPLSNYDVVHTNQINRTKRVLNELEKNFPPQFKNQLTELCTEYSDVFGLETEAITTNNFYKQKLRLKDSEPVYIKNYRSPHSHVEEIQKQVTN